jgi:NTE family protein
MSQTASSSPDVLVLGGGGVLGEAWMSAVLAGIDQAGEFDSRGCGQYIGTSAGSIVAASLAAGIAPDARLPRSGAQAAAPTRQAEDANALRAALAAAADLGGTAAAPLVALALSSTSMGGALLRRAALRRVPEGTRSLEELARAVERSGVGWDGRLRIAAVDLESGRRVMFGAPGSPDVSVAAAVQASCSIPGVFRPVRAGGREYVDGGVWSPTNMDAADVRRGSQVLCLNPTGSLRVGGGSIAGALGPVSRGVAGAEALALRHRGAIVETINPDEASSTALGTNLMDPRRRAEVAEAGLAQGLLLARTWGLKAA